MDLLTAAKSLTYLKKFIEDDLKTQIVNLHFSAVESALDAVKYANDKKSAYWSVITHLEDVEQAVLSQLKSIRITEVANQYLYVCALKALIYKYLNENNLVRKCFDDSLALVKKAQAHMNSLAFGLNLFKGVTTPRNWTLIFKPAALERAANQFNPRQFWHDMLGRDEDFDVSTGEGDPGDGLLAS